MLFAKRYINSLMQIVSLRHAPVRDLLFYPSILSVPASAENGEKIAILNHQMPLLVVAVEATKMELAQNGSS